MNKNMQLGNFSISLNIKDLTVSKEFYEKLGFVVFAGEEEQGWLVMKNGDTNIGLFQGMFDKNIMTFNPGWDQSATPLKAFTDVRDIQKKLKEAGITFDQEAEDGVGPASFMVTDPDGNQILFDQHVEKP